jgi:hypothetical protein
MSFRSVMCAAVAATMLTAWAAPAGAKKAMPAPRAADFTAPVRTLWAVAACGGDAAPAGWDAKVVSAHCAALDKVADGWRTKWLSKAGPFFAELLKGGYPETVVYPFGGGDLLTVLAVYPDATEYTTLSLEGMGDPRAIDRLAPPAGADEKTAKKSATLLKKRLDKVRGVLSAQLKMAWNTTIQLSNDSSEAGGDTLPAILTQALLAMDIHGYEPLEARYFRIEASGALVYLTDEDVAAWDAEQQKLVGKKKKKGENDLQVGAFTNVEIVFRKRGDAAAPRKVFRHIAADLSDGALEKNPGVLAHLAQKGSIAAMTKAASYLLWLKGFGKVRDYLLAHMQVMVSDDTGIPPRYAKPAGFAQECWGEFHGAYFGDGNPDVQKELKQFWKEHSKGKLPFRFGYYDNAGHTHLLYTHK